MKRYKFGHYTLDTRRQRLRKNGVEIPLTKRRYQVILILLENAGQLVRKELLLSRVWDNATIEESNLPQHIYNLRQLIEEDPRHPIYIRTVPGQGYKFTSDVSITESAQDEDEEIDELPSDAGMVTKGEEGPPETEPGDRQRSGRRRPAPTRMQISLISIGILVMGTICYIIFNKIRRVNHRPRPVMSMLTTSEGIESHPAFSPDGSMLVYSGEGESPNHRHIMVKLLSQGMTLRLTERSTYDQDPVWSPDGRNVAFLRLPEKPEERFHVIVVPATGGPEKEVGRAWGGLDWSPDGKYLAVSDGATGSEPSQITLLSVDGMERRKVSGESSKRSFFENSPRFSPDGRELAFVRWESDISGDIFILNLVTGQLSALTSDQKSIFSLAWDSAGRDLLFVSNRGGNRRLWRTSRKGGVWSAPVTVDSISEEIDDFSISPATDQLAYTSSINDTNVEIIEMGAKSSPGSLEKTCLISSSRDDSTQRFSPDGSQIVFDSNRTGFNEIWMAKSDCSEVRQLTNFGEQGVGSSRWSPSGKRIMFTRHQNGQSDLFMVDITGQNLQRLTNHPTNDLLGSWSIDEQSIFFTSNRTGSYQIWQLPASGELNGELASMLTTNGGREPIPAPDGRTLYFTRNEYLFRLDLATKQESAVPDLANIHIGRYWDVVDQAIYFVPRKPMGLPTIYRLNLVTHQTRAIHELKRPISPYISGVSVTKKEDLLSVTTTRYRGGDITLVNGWR